MSERGRNVAPSADWDQLIQFVDGSSAALDPGRLLERIVERLRDQFAYDFVAVGLIEGDDVMYRAACCTGRGEVLSSGPSGALWRLPCSEGPIAEVLAKSESCMVAEAGPAVAIAALEPMPALRGHLVVPLLDGDQVFGVVDAGRSAAEMREEDEARLRMLCAVVAPLIRVAQRYETEQRRWSRLIAINEIARLSVSAVDLRDVVQRAAVELQARFGYQAVGVFLVEEADVVLRAVASSGVSARPMGFREPISSMLGGSVVWRETPSAVEAEAGSSAIEARRISAESRALLYVPLTAAGRVVGAVQVESARLPAFDDDEQGALETLAEWLAGTVANLQARQQSAQMREDLDRMLVHDLRNPLEALRLMLDDTVRNETLSSARAETLREGIHSTEEILEMVSSLLDVARFEAGQARLRIAPGVLNDHVRSVVRRLAPLAKSRSIALTMVLSLEVPVLRFDRDLVDRMLANLVGNAVKFTPRGGSVTVTTEVLGEAAAGGRLPPPCVQVSVCDTGEGIPQEFQEKVFEKYGQVESRKVGLRMSTGLGLAFCRYVAEAHQGAIWVESEPGQGATFYVALPQESRGRTSN